MFFTLQSGPWPIHSGSHLFTSSHCKLDLEIRFKVPLPLVSPDELERAAAVEVFFAKVTLFPDPVDVVLSKIGDAAVEDPPDSLAGLFAVFTFGMAPVVRLALMLDELGILSAAECSSTAAAADPAAPADADRDARSMDTFGVNGELWAAMAAAVPDVL